MVLIIITVTNAHKPGIHEVRLIDSLFHQMTKVMVIAMIVGVEKKLIVFKTSSPPSVEIVSLL